MFAFHFYHPLLPQINEASNPGQHPNDQNDGEADERIYQEVTCKQQCDDGDHLPERYAASPTDASKGDRAKHKTSIAETATNRLL